MDIVKFILVVALILALHYLLWGQIYKGWLGHLKGLKKGLLFLAFLIAEALVTLLLGIYILKLN